MLQRIQTVWLFFSTVAVFSLFLFPFVQVTDAAGTTKTGVHQTINGQVVQTEPFLVLTIVTVIMGLIPFAIIFLYKNRKKQIMASYLAIAAILAYSFWLVQTVKQVSGNIALEFNNYGVGIILPSLAIFFLILAIRGIRRDEKLIRSADRLR